MNQTFRSPGPRVHRCEQIIYTEKLLSFTFNATQTTVGCSRSRVDSRELSDTSKSKKKSFSCLHMIIIEY